MNEDTEKRNEIVKKVILKVLFLFMERKTKRKKNMFQLKDKSFDLPFAIGTTLYIESRDNLNNS